MPEKKEVFIRSYNDFSHEFVTSTGVITIPSKWARPKNIATITPEQFEEVLKNDVFKVLFGAKNGGYKKLDAMPRDALDAAEKLSIAQDEAATAKSEAFNARLATEKAREEIERLKAQIEADGGTDAVLDKAKAEAKEAQDLLAEALAEIAELKAKKAKKAE